MKNKFRENKFLTIWIVLIIFLVGVCNFGFIRGTMAAFGDVTGQLTPPKTVKYISNYPSELELTEEIVSLNFVSDNFNVSDNTFIIVGYEFIGWNTMIDGSGETYTVGSIVPLETHINLYAQWKKVEVKIIAYGDVNINGSIDENDYLLIEKSINDSVSLEGQALSNADVNQDGKVDLIDADIIKQVVLLTPGYSGFFPDKPIYIYEIYQENGTSGDGNDNAGSDDTEIPDGGNDSSNEGDSGIDSDDNQDNKEDGTTNGDENNGSTDVPSKDDGSSGNQSSGNQSSGNTNEGENGSSNGGSSGNKKPNGGNKKPSNQDNKEEDKNNNKEEDKENESASKDEDKEDAVVEPEKDNDLDTLVEDDKNKNTFSYVGIIVVLICLLSLRIILYAIKKFKQKNGN